MYGIYHPLDFVLPKDFDETIVWKTPLIDIILTGVGDVSVINMATGATEAGATIDSYSWTIGDNSYTSKRVNFSLAPGGRYYISTGGFMSNVIEYAAGCVGTLTTKNDCSNNYHDWDTNNVPLSIPLFDPVTVYPEIETEETTIITANGPTKKAISQYPKERFQVLGPMTFNSLFNSLKLNSHNFIQLGSGNIQIKNIEVESSEVSEGRYGVFTLKYNLADITNAANSCCELINIDDIINPENPNGNDVACSGFTVSISASGDDLTAVPNGAPVGTPAYKWYRNGVLISTSIGVTMTSSGEYRLDISIAGCRATATYLKDNECSDYQIQISKVGNVINAVTSNVPDGETETISVKLNGVEVAASVPYTALASGTYFVYAFAGECTKVAGIAVVLEDSDCDFTVAIDVSGNTLTADTDAAVPSYQWYVDYGSGGGKIALGTASTQLKQGSGAYFLEVTNGACTKEAYINFANVASVTNIHRNSTGDTFEVYGITFASTDPTKITVIVDSTYYAYTGGTPTVMNTWSYNASNQIIFPAAFPLSNSLLIIIVEP